MNYRIQHIPISRDKRPGIRIRPEYITIHSTANPNSSGQNERDWLVNPINNRVASWHLVVDEQGVLEAIPLDEMAYHSGTREGNEKSISVEICESGNRKESLDKAARLVANLLDERKWGIDRLKRHFDWSGKNCPRIFNYNDWEGWDLFKESVEAFLGSKASPWAKESWQWAIENKISHGQRPRDWATREEVIAMIYRARGVK